MKLHPLPPSLTDFETAFHRLWNVPELPGPSPEVAKTYTVSPHARTTR